LYKKTPTKPVNNQFQIYLTLNVLGFFIGQRANQKACSRKCKVHSNTALLSQNGNNSLSRPPINAPMSHNVTKAEWLMKQPKKQSKLKRIAITTSPELRQALLEFTEVSGMAMSSFCRQMLEESIPVIQAMTRAYKVAYERSPTATAVTDVMDVVMLEALKNSVQAQIEFEEEGKKEVHIRKARHDRLVKD